MPILTKRQIYEMWQDVYQRGRGKEELKASLMPDRAVRNANFQAIEDAIAASGLDVSTLVDRPATTLSPRVQAVQDDLDAGQIPSNLIPVAEDWVRDNTPFESPGVDEPARDAWIAANMNLFRGIPGTREAVTVMVRAVLSFRIREAI